MDEFFSDLAIRTATILHVLQRNWLPKALSDHVFLFVMGLLLLSSKAKHKRKSILIFILYITEHYVIYHYWTKKEVLFLPQPVGIIITIIQGRSRAPKNSYIWVKIRHFANLSQIYACVYYRTHCLLLL